MFPLATTIMSETKANVSFSVYALTYRVDEQKDEQKGKMLLN